MEKMARVNTTYNKTCIVDQQISDCIGVETPEAEVTDKS